MAERRVDCFFYGLFMDRDVLRERGVAPENPRHAHVDGYALRIGRRATLVPTPGVRAYGMLWALTHAELRSLYAAPGFDVYHPEALLAHPRGGDSVPALCYVLPAPPEDEELNVEYASRLRSVLERLGFPAEYVESVG